jgi:hypothetical protein
MMRALIALIAFLALAALLVLATLAGGWWMVPVVSFLWTLVAPRRGNVIYASFAGALAWGAILMAVSREGSVPSVDHIVGSVMRVPGNALMGLTLLYAALIAGAAALIAQSIRPPRPAAR